MEIEVTDHPFCIANLAKCEPIKPVPPVISKLGFGLYPWGCPLL